MNLVKKLAIGASTIAFALSSVTPAFAATAWNKNISNGSFANAVVVESTTKIATTNNINTLVVSGNVLLAGSGGNMQLGNGNGNKMFVGGSSVQGSTFTSVNKTVIIGN